MNLRHPFEPDSARVQAQIRIMATTDLHLHLMPYDYVADRPTAHQGLLPAARLIRALRTGAPTTLLFDVGDMLQGSAMAELLALEEAGGSARPNPMIAAMNLIGYDAATLGNHDFDFGLSYLEHALAQARFPVVSANLQRVGVGLYRPPHVVIRTRAQAADGTWWPLAVGVIGFAPPQTSLWERQHLAGRLTSRDIVEAARAHLPALKAAGGEIVVALCHSGIGPQDHTPGMEHAAVPLAAVPGIDVVLAGHSHDVFPGPDLPTGGAVDSATGTLHGKPAVMAGFHGSHLGLIDLLIERGPQGWRPVAHASQALPVARRSRHGGLGRGDPALATAARSAHRRTLAHLRQPVGETAVPLHSYFSLIGPDAALTLLAEAQREAAHQVLAGTDAARLPLISAVSPYRVGGHGGPGHYLDIPPGPLTLRDSTGLYPYANALSVLAVTGQTLRDWLERAASMFCRIVPGGRDQPLLDPGFPGYAFDVLDGLTYQIDPTAPARTDAGGRVLHAQAQRIGQIRIGDRLIDPDEQVLIVTNSHRAGGGGGYGMALDGKVVADGHLTVRAALDAYLRRHRPVHPVPAPGWRFAPLPETSAWFDSSPAALAHLPLRRHDITDAGPAPDGFRRFLLAF